MRAGAETVRLLGLEMFFVKWARAGSWLRILMLGRSKGRAHRPRSAAAFEPPGAEPAARYMTSVPFVRLIGCVPAPVQLLLNVEPPLKLIWSAISCVQFDPPADAPP